MLTSSENYAITITHTTKGSHGKHWFTLFNHKIDESLLMDYVIRTLSSGQQTPINDTVTIIDNFSIRGVTYGDTVITAFPYWQGTHSFPVEIGSISEWSHTYNLEAIVSAKHPIGASLRFFATDYAFNRDIYRQQKNLKVNLVGLAYTLDNFNLEAFNQESNLKFSNSFCGYMPADEPDEIMFIGKIAGIREHTLGIIPGYLLTVPIALDADSECTAITLDIFIAQANLTIDIAIDRHVTGTAWLIGSLDSTHNN